MTRLIALLICLSPFFASAQHTGCLHKSATRTPDAAALDPRSDSIDITRYSIRLDFSALPTPLLDASCKVFFKAKVNSIDKLVLDLEGLTVDSVRTGGNLLNFSHQGVKLSIDLPTALAVNESDSVEVFYRGTPVEDASGFGGFSFASGYAYNIGVGFLADPHNFGRVWFPCFDNFVERSLFDVTVITQASQRAYCGGLLLSDTVEDGLRTMVWQLNQEIPSYLASVAVAGFAEVNHTYTSILNPELNVKLVAAPADTTPMKNAFVSLEPIFHEFEEHFGPYRWDRIGFVSVPFQAGAMEHATNIAYPRDLIGLGAGANQHIMAHELSHHWFGDLATCRTASEMWLNEGWASYCERLFDEWLISRQTYDNNVRSNHREMLNFAHVRDGGYWPLSNVPHAYTYSNHTYELPSDKIHTLRSYMGDSLFFPGVKHYLDTHTFAHATSNDLRDALEASSGLDLDDYFSDWVDTPGWAGFEVDSFRYDGANVKVWFRQKSAGNSHNYRNVPFQISFRNSDYSIENRQVILSGPIDSAEFALDFNPVMAYLNRNEAISHAVTAEERFVKNTGNVNWANALLEVNTTAVQDSVFLRLEHYWVSPDAFISSSNPYRLSPNRYWKVDGILDPGYKASLKFTFNGRTLGTNSGWLDHDLVTDETKLFLMWRPDNRSDWEVLPAIRTTFSSTTDKFGNFVLDSLRLGEYTFAELDSSLSLPHVLTLKSPYVEVFPNPAAERTEVRWDGASVKRIELFSSDGRSMGSRIPAKGDRVMQWETSHLTSGNYRFVVHFEDGRTASVGLVKLK